LINLSFSFRWPRFSDKFHAETKELLTTALNKGNKPPIIEDKIEVVELEMGIQVSCEIPCTCPKAVSLSGLCCQPPELEIRDIGDLTMEQFRGIFKLSYSGDAYIVIRTKVQVRF